MKLDVISIMNVWHALGGGELRGRRGKAFWRDGDGYNVLVDIAKNSWRDFVTGTGGYPLNLVMIVLNCDQAAALRWLEENCALDRASGKAAVPIDDRRAARHWAIAAQALADTLLESMDLDDPQRFSIAEVRRITRTTGMELIAEFRAWRETFPEFTRAMVRAGLEHEGRSQRRLAAFINQMGVADAA